jgi:tetratricopeptide (TPR) repeat protein
MTTLEGAMKRMAILLGLALIAGSILSAQGALSGQGKIKGTVLDEKTGQPLAGVTVRLFFVKTQGLLQPFPKTDAQGAWRAIYLRSGQWNIDFEKSGYETGKLSCRITETPGAKIPDIEIRLRPIVGLSISEDIAAELEQGNSLFDEKKYPEAMKKFEATLAKNPDLFIVNKNIGNCYFAMEKYEEAVASYEKIIEKQPDSYEAMILIGNAYNNAKNNEKAMAWYGRVPQAEIRDIDTLYNIGVNLYNAGKNQEAAGYFRRAVQIDPEFAEGFYQLGMTCAALNQIPETVEALNRFMVLAPDSPDVATARAIVDAFSKIK